MNRISYLARVACLVAVWLLAFSGISQAAMWVAGEVGGNFIANTDIKETVGSSQSNVFKNVGVGSSVLAGGTIGYDFVNSGFLGYDWPQWMSNFGVVVDMSFNRFPLSAQTITANTNINGVHGSSSVGLPAIEGKVWPLAFLVYAHYGCWRDTTCPGGRIHPYIGVGPAIAWSSIRVKGVGTLDAVSPALAVEAGVRWIVMPPYPITVDVALRYRYLHPSYDGTVAGQPVNFNFPANSFTMPVVRVAYHF